LNVVASLHLGIGSLRAAKGGVVPTSEILASNGKRFGNLPSAAGTITRLACAHLREAGVDPTPLLRKCGLSIEQIDNRTARLGVPSQMRFVELVAETLNDDFLGFHLARDFDLRRIGLLNYVFGSSEMLGEALQRAARYCRIANESLAIKYLDRGEVTLGFNYIGVARRHDCHQSEFLATTIVRACREMSGRRLQPLRVTFTHHRSGDCAELNAFMGVETEFSAEVDEVAFPANIKDIPLVGADPYLNDLLIAYCEEALALQRTGSGTLRLAVENALVPLLPHGKARLHEVASKLGMSERTLARRLASEGVSFNLILEELRFELAKRYIEDPDLSVSEIAWLLGYQEVSAFTHAFKRWSGKTPRQMRTEMAMPTEERAPPVRAVG
jgi:AraC-like DNA-binding protein